MKRSTLSALVDAAALIGLVALMATGFLIRYAFPAGSGALYGLGIGPRSALKPITLIWGLTRHEWGEVHFWIAVCLMAILALHLILHWRWIVNAIRGRPGEDGAWRVGLGVVGLLGLLAVAAAPFLSPKEQIPRSELQELRGVLNGPIEVPGRNRTR